MNEPVFSSSVCSEASAWPSCPNCKSREVLSRGLVLKCLSCTHSGPIVSKSPVLRFLRSYNAVRPTIPCAIHCGPFPQSVDDEFGDILIERCSELFHEQLFEREIFKAKELFRKNGDFPAVALTVTVHGSQPSVLKLSPPICDSVEQARLLLADQVKDMSAVAVIFNHKYSGNIDFMSETQSDNQDSFLVVNLHSYGSRSIAGYVSPECDGLKWDHLNAPRQIIWQPIDWDIISSDGVSEVIRYASAILVDGDVSLTMVVAESMDGAPVRAQISFRDPVQCTTTEIKNIKAATSEDAILKMKGKYKALIEQIKTLSADSIALSFEKEWGLECNHFSIIHQIKALVSNKGGKIE